MHRRRLSQSLALTALIVTHILAAPAAARAQNATTRPDTSLRVNGIFGDGMVIQRDAPIRVWGHAPARASVDVTFDTQSVRATASDAGEFTAEFAARRAGGPFELVVTTANERVVIRDILMGDVWVASGQSNMEWPVAQVNDAAREIESASDPSIRHFAVPHSWSWTPESDIAGGTWTSADPEHVGAFSAVAYFFARELRKSIDVPIGILNTSWSGSAIEPWMSQQTLELDDSAVAALERAESESIGEDGQRTNKIPTILYNRMVHPLLPFAIRGVIWYQGESNANNDEQARVYREQFSTMITSWRTAWRSPTPEFPFLWVQLANFGTPDTVPPATAGWALLRESQTAALSLPNTGQAVIIDIGDPDDIHPRNKQDVGHRLALIARSIAYGMDVRTSGPTYRRHAVRDDSVIIEFDNVDEGIVVRGGRDATQAIARLPGGPISVRGFAIAGTDRVFRWANARVESNRVIVWNDAVANPVAVRYAWSNSPNGLALYNIDGLPMAPFRTDDW